MGYALPNFLAYFSYSLLFIMTYFQVFLLLTLFEHDEEKEGHLAPNGQPGTLGRLPTVTILVPVYNEERTVEKTILSLFELNYPKDQLEILIVDDGSKDNTWNIIQKFKGLPHVTLHQKENGGKYTALNYGITHSTSEFIGCLDADSFVDKEALNYILPYFDDAQTVAVTPSLKIQNPDSILGLMQNAEYNMGIFIRKIFSLLDAQYVTPGPFSIFRKEIFKKVGLYRHAHNTEDLEMALRLQDEHYKITNAHKAMVYTVGPRTLYTLYRQRVRWTGGFIQNIIDYRHIVLNPKYGNFGMLILPAAIYSIIGTAVFIVYKIYDIFTSSLLTYDHMKLIKWDFASQWGLPSFLKIDWWYYNFQATFVLGALSLAVIAFTIWHGKKMTGESNKKFVDVLFFLIIYAMISPIWLATSLYNTLRQRDAAWR